MNKVDAAKNPAQLELGPEVLVFENVVRRNGKKVVLSGMNLRVRAGEIVTIIGGAAGPKAILARLLNGQLGADDGAVLRAGPAGPSLSAPMGFSMGGTVLRALEMRAAAYGLDFNSYLNAVASLLRDPEVLRKPLANLSPSEKLIVLYGSAYLLPCTHYANNAGPLPPDKKARAVLKPLFREARKRAAFICLSKRMETKETFMHERFLRLHAGRLHTLEEFDELLAREKAEKAAKKSQKA